MKRPYALLLTLVTLSSSVCLNAEAGWLSDRCNLLLNGSIESTELFTQKLSGLSWKQGTPLQVLYPLTQRASANLKIDAQVAEKISALAPFQRLGIVLNADPRLSIREHLLSELENQILLKIKKIRDFDSFVDALDLLKETRLDHVPGKEDWKISPLVRRDLLTNREIRSYLSGELSRDALKNKVIEAALKAFIQADDAKTLVGLIRAVKKSGIDKILPGNFLDKNPLVAQGLLDAKQIARTSDSEVRQTVFENLLNYSKAAKTYPEYMRLIGAIKHSDYDSKGIIQLLAPMTKLGREFADLHALNDSIVRSMKNGRLDVNQFVGDRLSQTLQLMFYPLDHEKFPTLLSGVQSGYSFSFAVKRLASADSSALGLVRALTKKIAASPFATRHQITERTIQDLLAVLKQKDSLSIDGVISALIEQTQSFGTGDLLRSLDSYDQSVNIISIKDQCDFGACWLHSPLEKYEIELSARLGEPVELSTDHLYFQYISNEYKRALWKGAKNAKAAVREGGYSASVPDLIRHFGVVPKRHLAADGLRSVRIEGYGTDLFDNELISSIRAEVNAVFDRYELDSKLNTLNPISHYEYKIDQIFSKYYETPASESFFFRGESFTPKTFAEKYLPEIIESTYVHYVLEGSRQARHEETRKTVRLGPYDERVFEISNMPTTATDIDQVIKNSITEGKPVQASFYWPSNETYSQNGGTLKFIDKSTGIMSVPSYDITQETKLFDGGHAVLIVGYELGPNGEIATYKILNSWGEQSGDHGIYHMSRDFFRNFLKYIDVNTQTGLGAVPKSNSLQKAHA